MSTSLVPRGARLYHQRRQQLRKWERLTADYATHLATSEVEHKWMRIGILSHQIIKRKNLLVAIEQSLVVELEQEVIPILPLLQEQQEKGTHLLLHHRQQRRRRVCAQRCCSGCRTCLSITLRDSILRDALWRITKQLLKFSWRTGSAVALVAWSAEQAGYSKTEVFSALYAGLLRTAYHVFAK